MLLFESVFKMKKILFSLFIAGALFANCQNKTAQNRVPGNKRTTAKIEYAGWEEGDLYQNIFSPHSLCTPWGGSISDSFARKGKKAVRFELRATDTICGNSKRAELYINSKTAAKENFTWYAWSEYLPDGYPFDKINEVHFQLHDYKGGGPPLIGFWVSEDRWRLIQTFDTVDISNQKHTVKSHDLGPVIKGKWVDWILHVNFSVKDNGMIQMWRNDSLVLDVKGANLNVENGKPVESPYMKFGIYKWRWKDNPGPFYPDRRVTYFDEVKMGHEDARLEDFLMNDNEHKN